VLKTFFRLIKKCISRLSPRIVGCGVGKNLCHEIKVFSAETFDVPIHMDVFGKECGLSEYSVDIPQFSVRVYNGCICNTGREEVFATRKHVIDIFTSQKKNPRIGDREIPRDSIEYFDCSIAHLSLSGLENNYYHWCVELLSRLYILQKSGLIPDRYILQTIMPFQAEYLEYLGIDRARVIPAQGNRWIKAKELIVPSLINNWEQVFFRGYSHSNKLFIPFWIKDIFNNIKKPKVARYQEKIYVSRCNAKYRKLQNEEELVPILNSFGYSIMSMDGISVSEQIMIFQNAAKVIGVHGAGLANILHCNQKISVLEFFPQYYRDSSIRVLCHALGYRYSCLVGETKDVSVCPQEESFTIQKDRFQRALLAFEDI
jgi:hypothetical protein